VTGFDIVLVPDRWTNVVELGIDELLLYSGDISASSSVETALEESLDPAIFCAV